MRRFEKQRASERERGRERERRKRDSGVCREGETVTGRHTVSAVPCDEAEAVTAHGRIMETSRDIGSTAR